VRITVEQAAATIGASGQYVRLGLQQGTLPIGSAVQRKKRWTYHISENLLKVYAGEEAVRKLKEGSM
jgi:hypothetical protein